MILFRRQLKKKQEAYDKAVDELDGVEKDIEAEVQKEIEKIEETNVDENGNKVKLSQADRQKIREKVNALPENVSLLKECQ